MADTSTAAPTAQTWVLGLAALGSFMVALDGLVVITALTSIRLDLNATIPQLEWTVNAFTLSFAVLLLPGAAIGDRYGRRRTFLAGLSLFTVASVACAVAPDVVGLITARAVQGVGAALVTPTAMALIGAAFPPAQRGRALGIYSAAIGLGVMCGPVVGGAITEGIAWQWIFWLNLPIGLCAIILVRARLNETYGPHTALDLPGVGLSGLASLGLVWGLVRGNPAGWASTEVVGAFGIGILASIAFAGRESRASAPMLPMRLFRSRAFTAGNVVSFMLFASNLGSTYFLAQFLQDAQGNGPLGAGLRLLPLTVALAVAAPRAGALVDRFGSRSMTIAGLLLLATGNLWIAAIASPRLAYLAIVAPLILAGVGTAMAMPAAQKAVVGAAAPINMGKAAGTFTMMRWMGGVFGIAATAAVFAGASGGYQTPQAFGAGFTPAMVVAGVLSLAGAATGAAIPNRE